jgi:transcriptional regulator with XRE-family HTH domain
MNLSQKSLVAKKNVDITYVSQLERGIANSSLFILIKISDALKINVSELIDPTYPG